MEGIKCCICGIYTKPYKGGMCLNCLSKEIDISGDIPKNYEVFFCPDCGRYLTSSKTWIIVERESIEMLGMLMKFVRKIKDVDIKDAKFVYTEPHSRRIKIKIQIQKTTDDGLILQDEVIIEFKEVGRTCNECVKKQINTSYDAIVQVRQKVEHKKTLFYLEQLILHNFCKDNELNCESVNGGLDFYFNSVVQANIFVSFVLKSIPGRAKTSTQLRSTDIHNSTASFETTTCITVPNLCKNDLCILNKKQYTMTKQIGNVLICHHISSSFHFINPLNGAKSVVSMDSFSKVPIEPTFNSKRMITFMVIEIDEPYVTVCRESDFGVNDDKYITKTYLKLEEGDEVSGYFLANSTISDDFPSCNVYIIFIIRKKISKMFI